MIKYSYIIICVCCCNLITAQTTTSQWQKASSEEIIAAYQKSWNWFSTTAKYALKLKYTSYKDHLSNNIKEVSLCSFKRIDKNYRTEALGSITIQNERYKLIIDTVEHVIVITNADKSMPLIADAKDLTSLLKNTKALKKKTETHGMTYKIDFKPNTLYDAYEFTINNNGYIERLVYYYSEQTEKDYDNNDQEKVIKLKPRLEIVFGTYDLLPKFNENEFRDKNIVLAESKKVTLLNKYKQYQLKDYRYQETN